MYLTFYKSAIYYFIATLIYLLMLPASLKIFTGTAGSWILNVSVVALILFSALILKGKLAMSSSESLFISLLLFILLLFSVYFIIDILNVNTQSLRYYFKVLSIILGIIGLAFLTPYIKLSYFYNVVVFFGLIISFSEILGFINYEYEGINYLTTSMPIVLGYLVVLARLVKNNNIPLNSVILAILLFSLLHSQSRSAFIIAILFLFVFLYLQSNRLPIVLRYWYFIVPIIIISNLSFFLKTIESVNYLVYARIMRIFSSSDNLGVTEEDRVGIYGRVLDSIYDLDNFFGYGFSAANDLFNVPYIESFALEYVLNFGILGLLIVIYISYSLYKTCFIILKANDFLELQFIYIAMILFFIKGWSVYDSIVIFIPLYLLIKKKGFN